MSAGEKAGVRPKIERRNGRIYFSEGVEQWSCWDPGYGASEAARAGRGGDWTWLINTEPTVTGLLRKVRLIRWAVDHVSIAPPAPPTPGGKP